jgi:hypothetical protein
MGVLTRLTRLEGWPERFADVVAAAHDQPYVLGTHDCLRFSCACIEAVTGHDFWLRFAGYKTRRQALVTIARIAPSLGDAVSLVLEQSPVRPPAARRADLLLYRDPDGEDHLGVCLGATVAVLSPDGLLQLPITDKGLITAWRVG